MVERSAAERICKDPNPIIDGRKANVNLAYLGAKPRTQATELLGTDILQHTITVKYSEISLALLVLFLVVDREGASSPLERKNERLTCFRCF